MRRSVVLVTAGVVAAAAALVLAPVAAGAAVSQTWPPFVLVTGLLLIGLVANMDGVFTAAAMLLERLPGGALPLYLVAMLLVAVVTALLNLDTSVAFLTPVLVLAARRRGADERRFLYGCVYMSNAASLLLPGSNLTNLLVLNGERISGADFAARMVAPWVAAVVMTTLVVGVACRAGGTGSAGAAHGAEAMPGAAAMHGAARAGRADGPSEGEGSSGHIGDEPLRGADSAGQVRLTERPRPLSVVAIVVAVTLLLALTDPALPMLAVGVALAVVRLLQRRLTAARIAAGVDVLSLGGVFLVAMSLGTLARVWSYPAQLVAGATDVATAALASLLSVVVNNLPAAVLLGSRMPAHPRALLLGLNVGPNLGVTGSLSALIWWQAARTVGAQPSALRYSAVGVLLVPLTLGAALAATHLPV